MGQFGENVPVTLAVDASPARKSWRYALLLTALVVQLGWMLNVSPYWRETNSTSRVCLALAIVEHGTFQIEDCLATYGDTMDKASYKGHSYTDKAPGTSFLFVPATALVRALTPGARTDDGGRALLDMNVLFYILRMLCVSLPTIGFWWFTLPWFREWTGREDRAIAVVAAGALGTNFAVYATQLFSHAPAAWFLFLAFLSVRRCWTNPAAHGRFVPGLLGGALAGAAFLNDYVVMLAVAVMGIATFLPRRQWRQTLGYGLGLAPSLAIWMGYNWICFDHPLTTGFMYHVVPFYRDAYASGFLGMQRIDPSAMLGMFFSPARGICFLSPVLALSPVGWWRQFRARAYRADALCAAVIAASLCLFVMTTVDWRGGWGIGTRYLVPAIPFLLVGIAGAVRGLEIDHPLSIGFGGLAVVGVVLVAMASATVPLFSQDFHNPLFTLAWPLVRDGYLAYHLATPLAGAVWGSVPYAAGLLLTCCLVMLSGPTGTLARRTGSVLLSVGLAGIVIAYQSTMPEPPQEKLARDIERADVLSRLGYLDEATHAMIGLTPGSVPMSPLDADSPSTTPKTR